MKRAAAMVLLSTIVSAGCGVVYRAGIKLYYRPAVLAEQQIVRNVPYVAGSNDPKQTLNLFVPDTAAAPAAKNFTTIVFVHGGNWDEGDKDYRFGGQDVYNNIGRFLAMNGYGTAVISYRLLPTVDWRAQADDVVQSVAWVHKHIAERGGNPDRIVVMGHSAGAQLALRTVLNTAALESHGVPASAIRGFIGAAGAGYDLDDERTYALGNDPEWYAKRFRLNASDVNWRKDASPSKWLTSKAPPSLIMHAEGETNPLKRQSRLLEERLLALHVPTTFVVAPGLSHTRIVPTLSRADRPAGAALLTFLRQLS